VFVSVYVQTPNCCFLWFPALILSVAAGILGVFASEAVCHYEHPGSFNCLSSLHVWCWNFRSLVEMDGGIKTATARPKGSPVSIFWYRN